MAFAGHFLALAVSSLSYLTPARFRQPSAEYQARRAKLRAKLDGPVVIFGYTGHEDASEVALFFQEPHFYYLTGHDEPGAAVLLLLPDSANGKATDGPHEILYLPPRDPSQEKWEGPKLGPDDPGVAEKTGFETVEPIANLQTDLARLSKTYPNFYTLLPPKQEEGYPHLTMSTQFGSRRGARSKFEGCYSRTRLDAADEVARRTRTAGEGH